MNKLSLQSLIRDLRTTRFWTRLATHLFAALGLIGATVGITDTLFPGVLPPRGPVLLLAFFVFSVIWGLFRSWPRPLQQAYQQPRTEICITVGDLFDQDGNIIVGMSTTFDTEVPHIISSTSLQGQLLARSYSNDREALNAHLDQALEQVPNLRSFSAKDGKRGKQKVYPLGTVAVIRQSPRKLFFCVAYSDMQADCTVQANVDGIWTSLNSLWRSANSQGNGDPISMGVIGGGLSRLSQTLPMQDSIRLTILSYMFASRDRPVSRRLTIVVRKEDLEHLDTLELQAFLRSLRAS